MDTSPSATIVKTIIKITRPALVLCLVAACGGSSTPTARAPSSPTANRPATTSAEDLPDPCALVTRDDLEAVGRQPSGVGRANANVNGRSCSYSADGSFSFSILLRSRGPQAYASDKEREKFRADADDDHDFETIDGLGDSAFLVAGTGDHYDNNQAKEVRNPEASLHVVAKGIYFELFLGDYRASSPKGASDDIQAIARRLIPQLP